MKRIVVGFDGSQASRAALGWALGEAELHGAQLTAWTTLEHKPELMPQPAVDVRALDPVAAAVKEIAAGRPVEHSIGYQRPAADLVAASADADLLVVGSRGRNPVAGLLLGSVSRACLHTAACPVVVVHPGAVPEQPHHRVIVGIDASPQARLALHLAVEEARLRDASLQAIHAVQWDRMAVELIMPVTDQLVRWGTHLVESELAATGATGQPLVVAGHAADVLVRHSGQADLLVLGSRGHNPLSGLLLGSTSAYCAEHARCPTMVVRTGPPTDDE